MKPFTTKGLYNSVKIRFLIYMLLLLLCISFIFSISFKAGQTLKNDSQIISTLAKQRMLTQSIAKNASRLSVIKNALVTNTNIQSKAELESKLLSINNQLTVDASTFERVYKDLSLGIVQTDSHQFTITSARLNAVYATLTETLDLWPEFKTAIEITLSEPPTSELFKKSLIYINESNELLMSKADQIVTTFESAMINAYQDSQDTLLALILLSVFLTIFAVLYIYKDLFKALNIFYAGFEKLGLNHQKNQGTMTIAQEVKIMLDGFKETLELTENINSSDSFTESLEHIYHSFKNILPYTYIGIALLKDNQKNVVASYGYSENKHDQLAENLIGHEVALSETSLEQIMLIREPRIINDLDAYFINRPIKKYSRTILDHGIQSSITLPLQSNGKPIGFIFFSSDTKHVYENRHIEYLKIISNSIALSFQKNIYIDELIYTSILALAKLSEARDEDTGDHLLRISRYVSVLANELKKLPKYKDIITAEFVANLVKFSPMHDIGKVGIPDAILLKPAKLTPEEFEIMKTHTEYGANVLMEAEQNINKLGRSLFHMGVEIAQNHHEKYDGTGYPKGLRGEDIPLSARIIAIADVFDALMSKRPYKEPFSVEKTLKIINDGKGFHFDPDVVDAFNNVKDAMLSLHK